MLRLLALFICCALPALLSAAEYHVATTGSDGASGSASAPWRHIQHAMDTLAPGDVVHIAAGIYNEQLTVGVSGSAGSPITFRGEAGTVIDGTGFSDDLLNITGRSYLVFEDLELRNISGGESTTPVLIRIASGSGGTVRGITLRRLDAHHSTCTGGGGSNGHAIGVWGENGSVAVSDILIESCQVHHCQLGNSEALVINGNVDGFTIRDCDIYDVNNIGIDAIGHEGTAGANDYARNGEIVGNRIRRVAVNGNPDEEIRNNPTYADDDYSAAGIYVDGGADILIEGNVVVDCDIGIEIASEHAGDAEATMRVTVRSNLIRGGAQGGILFGGYSDSVGWAEDCVIAYNTVYNCDWLNWDAGQIAKRKARNNEVYGNLLIAGPDSAHRLIDAQLSGSGNSIHDNHYFDTQDPSGSQAVFDWEGGTVTGWSGYAGLTGDSGSAFGDPSVRDIGTFDFRPSGSGSALVDAGLSGDAAALAGRSDAGGEARVVGGAPDRGAYEYQGASSERRRVRVRLVPALTPAPTLEHLGSGIQVEPDAGGTAVLSGLGPAVDHHFLWVSAGDS